MKMDISKGSLKAITRFDKMHMGISAFSCKEDCQKRYGNVLLFFRNHKVDYDYYSKLLFVEF